MNLDFYYSNDQPGWRGTIMRVCATETAYATLSFENKMLEIGGQPIWVGQEVAPEELSAGPSQAVDAALEERLHNELFRQAGEAAQILFNLSPTPH